MRVLFGLVLGALLTIAVAYFHDHVGSGAILSNSDGKGQSAGTASTTTAKPWVNWDVVGSDWHGFTQQARHAWNQLSAKLNNKT